MNPEFSDAVFLKDRSRKKGWGDMGEKEDIPHYRQKNA